MKYGIHPSLLVVLNTCVVLAQGSLPIAFEENRGQADPRVRYVARGEETAVLLTSAGAVLRLGEATVEMTFSGAQSGARLEGVGRLPGIANFFLGSDPLRWITNVPRFAQVRYHGLYPGVDVLFYEGGGSVEYDLLVAPGVDPAVVQLRFSGTDAVRLSAEGDLVLETSAGEIRQRRPAIYQQEGAGRRELAGRYRFLADGRVGFTVDGRDPNRPLVIDPVLSYNVRMGPRPTSAGQLAGSERGGSSIGVDAAGNAYVVGTTSTADFPVTPGAWQTSFGKFRGATVYVAKLDPTGANLLYATFLGGEANDTGTAIAVDAAGNAYVTGFTTSVNFATTRSAFRTTRPDPGPNRPATGFVAKLNPTGSALFYSTYLGGIGADSCRAIAIDSAGNAYVAGTTLSADFPTTSGAYRPPFAIRPGTVYAFLTKINVDGSGLAYSTVVGNVLLDRLFLPAVQPIAVAVDNSGSAYLAGMTPSVSDYPATPGAMQTTRRGSAGFVTKFTPSGNDLVYSTFVGGSAESAVNGITVDSSGSAYLVGFTSAPDFPVTPGAFLTAFVSRTNFTGYPRYGFAMKLNAAGSAPIYSTYLGGTGSIVVSGVAVDAQGRAFIAGSTDAPNFPTTPGALQPCIGNEFSFANAFLFVLDAAGSRPVYSTYLGGNVRDDGAAIVLDRAGSAYLTGRSDSTDFPPTSGAFGRPSGHTFISKIDFSAPSPAFAVNCIANTASVAAGPVAPGEIVTLSGAGLGPAAGESLRLNAQGRVDTTLAGVRVLFDGVPAPLLFVSANEIRAIVPFAVTPRTSTDVQVEFQGSRTAPRAVTVRDFSPAIFTLDGSGIGQGAIQNADGTLNSPENPAARGSFLTLYTNGLASLGTNFVDGEVATLPQMLGTLANAQLSGVPVPASYLGPSPGSIRALVQMNVVVPANAPTGAAVLVGVVVSSITSRQRVTVAIR